MITARAVVTRLLLWPPLLLLLLNGWFFLQQPHMTFFPSARLAETPAQWRLPYEEVWLQAADGVGLYGWYLPVPGATHTLLFFHGNGGNISHRGDSLAIFHRLGLNVLIIDYRGYGKSEGEPDEAGLYRDAMAAWRYLVEQRRLRPEQIILFGRSLGGAVAAQLATQVTPAALILESTFSSAHDMAQHLFPLLSQLIILRYRFDTAQRMREHKGPLLILHSRDDEIIPYAMGQQLFALAAEPKYFVTLRGGHNDGFMLSQPAYEQALDRFITGLPRRVLP